MINTRLFIGIAAFFFFCLSPQISWGQFRERVQLTNLRIGFQSGNSPTGMVFRIGQWAPVSVDITCLRDTEEPILITVGTIDGEEALTYGTIELPPMTKGQVISANELTRLAYLKPGGEQVSVTASVTGKNSGTNFGSGMKISASPQPNFRYIVGTIGFSAADVVFPTSGESTTETVRSRNGWVATASLTEVGQLPDRWFGYDAFDVLVVGTGSNADFWQKIALPEHTLRRQALAEWVARGGKVVLSVGSHPERLFQIPELVGMLPVTINPTTRKMVNTLSLNWENSTGFQRQGFLQTPGKQFGIVELGIKKSALVSPLIVSLNDSSQKYAYQGSFGSGKVSVIGFDLDGEAFTACKESERQKVWENVVQEGGVLMPDVAETSGAFSDNFNFDAASLNTNLDYFEKIPTISFSWVAGLIFLFILLMGPVEYLILRRLFKRMEITWITMPLLVVVISATVYLVARTNKGDQLRINKIDLVDIDLVHQRVEGQTWFTLYSPVKNNYSITTEPNNGQTNQFQWVLPDTEQQLSTNINWFAQTSRSGAGNGILANEYYYHVGDYQENGASTKVYADELRDVPIQVWSTKGFTSRWNGRIDSNKPLITADLHHTADPNVIAGSITSNLPTHQYSEVALLWNDVVYDLSSLPFGVPQQIVLNGSSTNQVRVWLNSVDRYPELASKVRQGSNPNDNGLLNRKVTPMDPSNRLWSVLFADASKSRTSKWEERIRNANLRHLDQSWRIGKNHKESAVLVLRIPNQLLQETDNLLSADAPSRVVLREMQNGALRVVAEPPEVRQETYIRVFIPIQPRTQQTAE
ncbi:MAG: hypothetical protein R3B84_05365 [Zavarzinella sp.]